MGSHLIIDLTGHRYGRFVVLKLVEPHHGGNAKWICQCDCGERRTVSGGELRRTRERRQLSCGCHKIERMSKLNRTHGVTKSRLYKSWQALRQRCENPHDTGYSSYGARGISVCKEWAHFEPFRDWATINGYADHLEIDRIDVNGNYAPHNCRWVTTMVNMNNRRNTRRAVFFGIEMAYADACRKYGAALGITSSHLKHRIAWGWTPERAVTTPVKRWTRS